jgi:tRNA (guanine-N7-)-methyltransferase
MTFVRALFMRGRRWPAPRLRVKSNLCRAVIRELLCPRPMTEEGESRRQEAVRYDLRAPKAPEGEFDLRTIVPGDGDLELDIGFGRGQSLFERARTAPTSRVIGIEIKTKWAAKVSERAARDGLTNARVFCGDAREILARGRPDACVRRVFVHFPDPWWKKRHAKRAVVDEGFLDHVARLLAPGGELFVQTDVEDRAAAMRARIEEHGAFEVAAEAENVYGARSNREVRADEDGLPVHRILAHRRGSAAS